MDRISPRALTLDPEIQSRAQLDMVVIQDYADAMKDGAQFPPIKAVQQNGTIWVYSGFHRTQAAIKAGVGILAEIEPGTFQDAQWKAAAENQDHGLRRTNADKRRAVEKALTATEGVKSDNEIAKHCGVSQPFASKVRSESPYNGYKVKGADGKTYDTSNIGRSQEPEIKDLSGKQPRSFYDEPEILIPYDTESQTLPYITPDPEPPQETKPTNRPKFNRANDNIEWAAFSWNPVTGCKHGCPYCYARDIANRFFPQGFEPAYHPDRLAAPMHTKHIGPRWEGDAGNNNVFVCSMADLFGDWVPDEWIKGVMDVVSATPQWRYIFLTKNPARLATIDWPKNSVVGTTVDVQARVGPTEAAFAKVNAPFKFVSCEPLREKIEFASLHLFDWVLVGGQSKSTQEAERQPLWDWVEDLIWQTREAQCKLYMKTNLTVRAREFPTWGSKD